MSLGIRLFIGFIFTLIGLSFLATTGTLVWEFWNDRQWLTLASFYSHLFIFFPTFGIVTLIAFYMPACVFTDMYLRHIPWGTQRYAVGFLVAVGLSIVIANMMVGSKERSVFEISPSRLAADSGEPRRCAQTTGQCSRLPVLVAVDNVRRVSQHRVGLNDLARDCRPDALKEVLPEELSRKRYCFVTTRLPSRIGDLRPDDRITDRACCQAQQRFVAAVNALHAEPDGRSITSLVHTVLLPFKVFFGLILLIISVLLAVRQGRLELHYRHMLDGIERGVLIGAAAMVIYPIMSHAFLQSAALLYFGSGPSGGFRSTAPLISFALGAWGLLLLFFFWGRRNQEVQNLARIGGIVGSAVAIVKYEQIIDFFVLLFGSGAGPLNLILLCGAAVVALAMLARITTQEFQEADDLAEVEEGEVTRDERA